MATLSVVIPTKNCATLLARTLAALDFADEIIVVDMFSTDGTAELARNHPRTRLIQRDGYIYENVNAGIDAAAGDWIMRLDSDEVPTREMGLEIRERIGRAPADLCGYWAPSRTYWCGRWLRYGPAYDPRSPVAGERFRKILFRRGTARYRCASEHEDISVSGRYEFLKHRYDHYSIPSVATWIAKANYYSDRDVERADAASLAPGDAARAMAWQPLKTFLVFYIKRKGFLDGALGLLACGCYALYTFVDRAKRWERCAGERAPRSTFAPAENARSTSKAGSVEKSPLVNEVLPQKS